MTLDEVIKRTGATERQLWFWRQQGYVRPVGAGGSGRAMDWSADEVRVATTMKRLIDNGVTARAAAHAARNDGVLPRGARVVFDAMSAA